jgi:hypothetical protein
LFERLGTLYEGQFVLTVSWLPPACRGEKRLAAMELASVTFNPD